MTLLDEALALAPSKGPTCALARLERENPTLYTELQQAVVGGAPWTGIAAALRRRGWVVGTDTLRRHFAGRCHCVTR